MRVLSDRNEVKVYEHETQTVFPPCFNCSDSRVFSGCCFLGPMKRQQSVSYFYFKQGMENVSCFYLAVEKRTFLSRKQSTCTGSNIVKVTSLNWVRHLSQVWYSRRSVLHVLVDPWELVTDISVACYWLTVRDLYCLLMRLLGVLSSLMILHVYWEFSVIQVFTNQCHCFSPSVVTFVKLWS